MKIVILLAIIFQLKDALTQGVYTSGARNVALSNATVAISDEWSYFNNPGAISVNQKVAFGVSYENRFLLKEMQSQSFVGVIPLKKGVLSIGGQLYGFSQLRSFKSGVGYAMPLAEFVSAGVQLNFQGVRLNQNYGSSNTMTAELGVLTKLNKKLSIGFSVFNLGSALLDDYQNDRYTNVIRLGAHYMYLRGGYSLQPVSFSFGFGYVFVESISLDFGTAYHQQLGWSPAVSCLYKFP